MAQGDHCNTDKLAAVRAGFIVQGTTLTQWCRSHGVDPSWAFKVMKGEYLGNRSQALRRRLLMSSGADSLPTPCVGRDD